MQAGINFFQNILSKLGLTVKTQPFVDSSGAVLSVDNSQVLDVFAFLFYSTLFVIIAAFTISLGSARLSYCYNISIGNSGGVAFLFSILCFIFPFPYIPFYAFFLHTACSPPVRGFFSGGAKRGGGRK